MLIRAAGRTRITAGSAGLAAIIVVQIVVKLNTPEGEGAG
jgi:hypothetical protein